MIFSNGIPLVSVLLAGPSLALGIAIPRTEHPWGGGVETGKPRRHNEIAGTNLSRPQLPFRSMRARRNSSYGKRCFEVRYLRENGRVPSHLRKISPQCACQFEVRAPDNLLSPTMRNTFANHIEIFETNAWGNPEEEEREERVFTSNRFDHLPLRVESKRLFR